jgi:hypothetical protein
MAALSIIITAPEMKDRLRDEIAELGATLEQTIWYAEGTLEWQVTIDDVKLAELLAWCETAGCRSSGSAKGCHRQSSAHAYADQATGVT